MKYRDFWKYANPTPKQEEEPKKIGTWDYLTNYADDDLAFGFGHMLGNIADMTERATRPDGMTPQEWAGQQPDILKNFLTGTRTTSQNLQEGLDVPELEEGSLPYHLRNVVRSTPESVATMLVGSAIGGPIGAAVGGIGGKVAQKLAPALLSSNKARSTLFELQKLYQSNSFPAKVARALTPASGEMIGAMGLSSALEANSEYQGNINEYIADAKQNGTYVPGQTELEAEEKTKDSFLQNLGWISALNYPTFRVFYGGGKFTPGLLPMTKRIAGGGLAEAVEETGQEVINLLSLDKPPDETRLWDAAVAGGLMGTGFHAAGEIANYRSNKKQSQFEEALRKFGKEYSDNIGGITQGEDGSVRYSDDSIYGNFRKEVNDALGNNGNAEGNQDVYRGENGGAEGKYWVRNPNMNVSTEGMRPESLNALDMLGKYFYDNTGKPLILNAGTNGDNHAEGEFSHYNGWKFDIIDQLDGDGALITADYGRGPFLDQFIQYGRSLGLGMNFEGTGTNNVHLDVAVDGTQWDGNGDHAGGFNPQNARPSEPQGNSYDPNFTDRQNEVWQAAQYASQRLRDKHGIRLAPEVIYRQWALEDGGDFTHPSYNWGGLKDTAGNFRSFGSDREYADAYVDDFMALRPEINNVTDENGMVDDKSFTDVMLQTGYIVDSDYNNYINGLANISAPKTGYSGNSSSNATVPQWQQYLKEHQNKPSRIISNPAGGNPPKDDEPPKPLFDLDAEDSMTQNLLEKFLNERADQAIADNNVQEAEFIIGMFDDNSVFQNTQANREALAQRYGDALNTFFQNNLQEQTQPDSQQEEPETKGKSKKEKPYDRNATVIGKGREFLNELMKKADATSKENAWKLNSAIQNNDVAGVENILKQNNVAVPEPKQAQTQSSQDPVKENTSPENVLSQANKNTKGQEKLIKRASQNVTPKTSRNKKQNIGNAIIQLANQNGIAVSGVDFQSLRNGSSKKIKEWQAKLSEAGAFTVQPQQSNPAVGQSQTSESEQEEIDLGNGVTAFRPKGWQPPEPTLKERLNQFLAKARETERLNQEREKEADLANEDDESDTTPLIQSSLFDSDKADKRNQNEDDLLLRQEDEEGRAKQRQQEKENFDAAVKVNSQRNFGALADKAKQAKDRYDATRVDPIHQQQQAVSEAQEDEEYKEDLRRREDQDEDAWAKDQSPEQIRKNYQLAQHLGDASTVERLQKLAEEGRKQRDQEKEQLKVADQQAKGNAGKDILRLLRAPEYSAAKARIESIPNLTTALVNGNIDAIRHARKILAETNPQIKSKPQTKPKPSNEKLASIANAPISQKSSERTTQGKALVRLAQESGIPLAPKLETALKNGYARAIEEAQNLIGEKNPKTSQEEFADSEESVNLIQSVAQKLKVKDRPALRYWVATQANNLLQAPNSESGQAAREALESLDVRDEYSEEELNRFENDDKVSKPFSEALRVVMGDSTQKISAPKLESPKLESSQPAAQSAQTQGQAQLQSQLQIQAQEQPKALPAPSEAQPQTQPQSQPQTQEQPQIQSQQQETSQPSVQTQTAPQAQEQSQPQVQEQQQEVAQPQAQEQEVTPEESRPQISPEEETAPKIPAEIAKRIEEDPASVFYDDSLIDFDKLDRDLEDENSFIRKYLDGQERAKKNSPNGKQEEPPAQEQQKEPVAKPTGDLYTRMKADTHPFIKKTLDNLYDVANGSQYNHHDREAAWQELNYFLNYADSSDEWLDNLEARYNRLWAQSLHSKLKTDKHPFLKELIDGLIKTASQESYPDARSDAQRQLEAYEQADLSDKQLSDLERSLEAINNAKAPEVPNPTWEPSFRAIVGTGQLSSRATERLKVGDKEYIELTYVARDKTYPAVRVPRLNFHGAEPQVWKAYNRIAENDDPATTEVAPHNYDFKDYDAAKKFAEEVYRLYFRANPNLITNTKQEEVSSEPAEATKSVAQAENASNVIEQRAHEALKRAKLEGIHSRTDSTDSVRPLITPASYVYDKQKAFAVQLPEHLVQDKKVWTPLTKIASQAGGEIQERNSRPTGNFLFKDIDNARTFAKAVEIFFDSSKETEEIDIGTADVVSKKETQANEQRESGESARTDDGHRNGEPAVREATGEATREDGRAESSGKDSGRKRQDEEKSGRDAAETNAENERPVRENGAGETSSRAGTGIGVRGDSGTVQSDEQRGQSVRDDGGGLSSTRESTETVKPEKPEEETEKPKEEATKRETAGHNFHITKEHGIGEGGLKTKFKQNIDAIKLLKQLESEGRRATPSEQAILAKFNGWGTIASVFSDNAKWQKEQAQLKELLTKEEYESAHSVQMDAFYTSPEIAQAIWQGVTRLGFKGGKVLDPSTGSGIFFGTMPIETAGRSLLAGTELDSLTGRIAKQLYQNADIEITGFQNRALPDNYFDLAITNVPFSNAVKILSDPAYRKNNFSLHNYFFAKSIDKVRPGGLVAFITSTGTLNSPTSLDGIYPYLNQKADLIAAFKLPSNAFDKNAGTQVTTDVVIFQKRLDPRKPAPYAQGWGTTQYKRYDTGDDSYGHWFDLNRYFVEHPEHMLGKPAENTLYPNSSSLALDGRGRDVAKELGELMSKLPEDIFKPIVRATPTTNRTVLSAPSGQPDGSFSIQDGKVFQKKGLELVEVTGKAADVARDYIHLLGTLDALLKAQIDPAVTDEKLSERRKLLNQKYDSFVKKHGHLNSPTNLQRFVADPNYGRLSAIENYKPATKKEKASASKADIFSKRTVEAIKEPTSANTPIDGLSLSLAFRGRVDMDYISSLTGKSEAEVVKALGDLIYRNPETNLYELSEEYLSGNVREKLAYAKEAARTNPAFKRNVKALEKVQPVDLTAEDIAPHLGATWIKPEYYEEFIRHILHNNADGVKVSYSPVAGIWTAEGSEPYGKERYSWQVSRNWHFWTLFNAAMNKKTPTVEVGGKLDEEKTALARDKVDQLREEFKKWLWADDARKRDLLETYNAEFNSEVLRTYESGASLTFPTAATEVRNKLYPHQKNAIWRMLQGKNTLLAHCVGAGKTWEMQIAAMEMKRLGIIKKPLFVVPTNILKQFEGDFRLAFPDAKLLVLTSKELSAPQLTDKYDESIKTTNRGTKATTETAEETKTTKKETEEQKQARLLARRQALTKIATGDWDGIILSHDMFMRLPMSPDTYNEYYREQIQLLTQEKEMQYGSKAGDTKHQATLAAVIQNLKEKLTRDIDKDKKEIVIPFEELGIDQIFVDEADMFKNLGFNTRYGTSKNDYVAGISTSNARRSVDMYIKTKWLTKMRNGGGVVFATGTPISNTLNEIYTMQRYLDYANLEAKKIHHFDNWAGTFAEEVKGVEASPSGNGFREVTRLKLTNLPSLITMFRKVADIKLAEDLPHLTRPKLKNDSRAVVQIEPTNAFKEFKKELLIRADDIHSGKIDPKEDNYLKIVSDFRKASLDMRLIDPTISESEAGGKIDAICSAVATKYKETADVKGTQLIFSDLSVPKPKEKNKDGEEVSDEQAALDEETTADDISVYERIKKGLIARGIPAEQIAFVHEAKNANQRKALFERVNNGDIRVIIGSTTKMGAGTNFQKHLVALHHLDCPWRPRDIEQREGRILRSGNENEEVEIFTYVTKGSYDANMWEKISIKQHMIDSVMRGDPNIKEIDDISDSAGDYESIAATGFENPLMGERARLNSRLNTLKKQQVMFAQQRRQKATDQKKLEAEIPQIKQRIADLNADIALKTDTTGDAFKMKLGGTTYTNRPEAKKAFTELVESFEKEANTKVGEIGGFDINMRAEHTFAQRGAAIEVISTRVLVQLANNGTYSAEPSVQSIEHFVSKGIDKALEYEKNKLKQNQAKLDAIRDELAKPFPKQAELNETQKRLDEVTEQIERGASKQSVESEEPVDDNNPISEAVGQLKKIAKGEYSLTGTGDTRIQNFVADNALTPQQKLIQSFGEKLGVKTTFFRNDNSDFHGAHAGNTSYINVNSEMPLGQVFWHESMHWLKNNNPKLYQQLVKAAGITDEQRQAYLEKTERTDLKTDDEINEEIIADYFEDVAKRNGLLQSIAGKNRGLVERVVQWLKDTMNKFIEFFHNPQGKLTTKQKQALSDEFGKIASRLVDPNGERIFRHNRRTHNIELADGRHLSSIQADADTKYSFAINNGNYLQAVEEYQNAKTDEERQAALKKLQGMVQLAAEAKGFHNAVPEQTVAYKVRTTAAPKKTIKVYKVFTVANDGSPTALFVGGTEKLPQGVWLDAQDAWHFTAKNGNDYVPSTQNPFTKGGKTGGSVEIPNEATRQELIKRGFLPKGSKATKITALAYRPGWHAGTLPFFPQGGKKRAGSNYENIHRYNQVVFECELAADKNYTAEAEAQPKARNKDGSLNSRKADLQYMPKDGFYYYATNPLTHGNPKLGNWAISGSLKINRALTQEECDKILADHGKLPQEWEQGKLNLADLGYTGEQNDAARKTLAPITYDDNGNVIPLSQRFNAGKEDIRYSFAGKKASPAPQSRETGNDNLHGTDNSDNSSESLTQKIRNAFSSWWKGGAKKNRNREITDLLYRVTGYKVDFGNVKDADKTIIDDMHKVIRAKHAYEWDKLLPQIGGKIAKSLKLSPTEEMSNYIADWCMTGAVGNSSSEAKAFETAMRNDPVTAGLMLQIREAFQEFNDMTAEQKIGDTLVSRLQGKSPREIARTLWGEKEEQISDDLHPVLRQINDMIAKAEKTSPTLAKLMKEDINPYQMMRLLRGVGGLGDLMIGTEKTNDIEDVRDQFRAIYPRLKFDRLVTLDMIVDMAGGKKHVDGLMKYAVAKLDKEMHEKLREDPDADIRPQFSEAVDDEVIKNGEAQYAKAHRSLVTYSNILLCIQHDAGLIGTKAFSKAIKGWKNYIPMIRVFEEGEDFKFEDSLKHKTGSQRSTYNPMETLTQNTYDILSRAERNKAKQQLAFYARIGEFGDIIQEVETSNPGNNVITFREGGKIKYLKVFDPAVKRAVDNIYSPADTSWIMKFLRATMNIVRNMRTIGSVDFAIGNPFRDMQDAYIHNRHADANPLKALLDTFREGFKGFGFKRILREKSLVPHDTDWAEFNALGGTQSTFVSEDVDQLRRSMNKLTRKTFMESFKEAPLHTVLDRLQWLSEQTEYMTRLNSYKRAKAELAKQHGGNATLADKRLAALEARDASIDFAKAGTSTRKINQLLMFANAQVQDWAKWGVIGRDLAKGGEARKIATQKIGRLVLNGVVTTLLFAALNRSDDDRKEKYKKRPDGEKETYWIFGDGVRIPKGQDIVTRFVSALTDEFIDKAMDDDPVSTKRLFKIIRDAVPSIIPSLIEPAYEVRMNYSAFRDAPIVPVGQQRLDKAEQYGKYTSSFAKLFSEMTGLTSPRGVDYLINGYLGSTGRFVTQAPDYLFKRGMTLNDVLMVRRFAFDPAENTKTVKDYYEAYDEQYKHYNTYKLRRKWDKNAKPHEDFDPKLYSRLKAAQEPLQHISKMENDILRNPKLDWDTKNKKIRELEKKREKICERVFKRAR